MKSELAVLMKKYHKLNMIINFRAIKNEEFVKCVINKIEIAKTLYITEVQLGNEVFIPKELTQDHLPKSFRYYDPIF